MQSSASDPAILATTTQPHALPYRIILEEIRARRSDEGFLSLVTAWSSLTAEAAPTDLAVATERVDVAVAAVESAYTTLRNRHLELRLLSKRKFATSDARQAAVDTAHQNVLNAAFACQQADTPLKKLLHLVEGSALCFSGGGIRSASFSLGVLQGFARSSVSGGTPGFLRGIDYLSSVSGGGYISSWFMGWIKRSTFANAVHELGTAGKTAGDPEPDAVRYLRDYTSFLAPRPGLGIDAATLASIVVRNLFLNWIIFLPCLAALLLLPRILDMVGNELTGFVNNLATDQVLMWIAAAFIAIAGSIAAYRASQPPGAFDQSRSRVRSEILFLWVGAIAAWLIVEAWWAGWTDSNTLYERFNSVRAAWLIGDLIVATIPMSVVRLARDTRGNTGPFRSKGRVLWGRILWSVVAPAIASTVTAITLELFAVNVGPLLFGYDDEPKAIFHVLAFPIVLSILMFGSALLSGLLSAVEEEEEREWWARAGGVFLIVQVGWIATQIYSWYPEQIAGAIKGGIVSWVGASAFFGVAAASAGKSAASESGMKKVDVSQLGTAGRLLARYHLLTPLLAFCALVCILLLVGDLTMHLIPLVAGALTTYLPGWIGSQQLSTTNLAILFLLAAAVLQALVANYCINVNTFSLHGMYRLRLVRAFMGASNFGRDADRFTNFDNDDNFAQADLQSMFPGTPIHIVNSTLNLVDVHKQAWQQRKAESFTLSPLQCGSWRVGYARTESFGGLHGISLGTSMAISGAAFNPNMGYNSSPLVTLVMTLFNARLGWWLPNPGWAIRQGLSDDRARRYLSKTGPTFALASIVSEALGKTDDRRKWIQLSDGGHFENLALYEMVLRRCRHIVVVDAGADRDFQFEDLGNAIRKIQIDLGIPITFPGLPAWPTGHPSLANKYCAVGKIDYCCVDGGETPPGYLVYIKPCLTTLESRDVTAYAVTHPAFPHESTMNQFFNEAQFESYRHLGSQAVDAILNNAASNEIPGILDAAFAYSGQPRF